MTGPRCAADGEHPGLGGDEVDENSRYGEHAARVCDHVIVVRAKTADALIDGLSTGGLEQQRLHLVDTLDQATEIIGTVARAGDVVLFANDLPDTYLPVGRGARLRPVTQPSPGG